MLFHIPTIHLNTLPFNTWLAYLMVQNYILCLILSLAIHYPSYFNFLEHTYLWPGFSWRATMLQTDTAAPKMTCASLLISLTQQ